MRRLFQNRGLRSTIACGVALLQIHLLWLTVFHHHGNIQFPLRQATFDQGSRHSPLTAETGRFCTACQIVRNSALRPTVSLQAPEVASSVPLLLAVPRDHLPSFQRVAVFGRAPPLS